MSASIVRATHGRQHAVADWAPRHKATRGQALKGTRYSRATAVVTRKIETTPAAIAPARVITNTYRNDGLGAHSMTRARLIA